MAGDAGANRRDAQLADCARAARSGRPENNLFNRAGYGNALASGETGRESGPILRLHLEAFSRLSPQDRAAIAQLAQRNLRELAARRDVIREGEKPRGVNLILEGWACRYKTLPDGRRQIVHFMIPGDLGDRDALLVEAMDHSVGAITRLRYAEIPAYELENVLARNPELGRAARWGELVATSIAREWTANVGQRTAYERLAHLLCEMFWRLRNVDLVDERSCDWPLTQADLADATGLTPVHVNRTLQALRRHGLIVLAGRRLTLPDLDRLMGCSTFNANYLHLGRTREAAAAGTGMDPVGSLG